MIFSNRLLCIACLVLYGSVVSVLAQTSSNTNLTRDDVVLVRNKPSIYLCVDRDLMNKRKEANDEELWLRINNNTVWTIRFKGENRGTSQQLITLSNGTTVAGLANDSVVSPRYQLESKKVRSKLNKPLWGDIATNNWLPSGASVIFKVPKRYFNGNYLFIEYNYEWEFAGVLEQESDPPLHRIYFYTNEAENILGRSCK